MPIRHKKDVRKENYKKQFQLKRRQLHPLHPDIHINKPPKVEVKRNEVNAKRMQKLQKMREEIRIMKTLVSEARRKKQRATLATQIPKEIPNKETPTRNPTVASDNMAQQVANKAHKLEAHHTFENTKSGAKTMEPLISKPKLPKRPGTPPPTQTHFAPNPKREIDRLINETDRLVKQTSKYEKVTKETHPNIYKPAQFAVVENKRRIYANIDRLKQLGVTYNYSETIPSEPTNWNAPGYTHRPPPTGTSSPVTSTAIVPYNRSIVPYTPNSNSTAIVPYTPHNYPIVPYTPPPRTYYPTPTPNNQPKPAKPPNYYWDQFTQGAEAVGTSLYSGSNMGTGLMKLGHMAKAAGMSKIAAGMSGVGAAINAAQAVEQFADYTYNQVQKWKQRYKQSKKEKLEDTQKAHAYMTKFSKEHYAKKSGEIDMERSAMQSLKEMKQASKERKLNRFRDMWDMKEATQRQQNLRTMMELGYQKDLEDRKMHIKAMELAKQEVNSQRMEAHTKRLEEAKKALEREEVRVNTPIKKEDLPLSLQEQYDMLISTQGRKMFDLAKLRNDLNNAEALGDYYYRDSMAVANGNLVDPNTSNDNYINRAVSVQNENIRAFQANKLGLLTSPDAQEIIANMDAEKQQKWMFLRNALATGAALALNFATRGGYSVAKKGFQDLFGKIDEQSGGLVSAGLGSAMEEVKSKVAEMQQAAEEAEKENIEKQKEDIERSKPQGIYPTIPGRDFLNENYIKTWDQAPFKKFADEHQITPDLVEKQLNHLVNYYNYTPKQLELLHIYVDKNGNLMKTGDATIDSEMKLFHDEALKYKDIAPDGCVKGAFKAAGNFLGGNFNADGKKVDPELRRKRLEDYINAQRLIKETTGTVYKAGVQIPAEKKLNKAEAKEAGVKAGEKILDPKSWQGLAGRAFVHGDDEARNQLSAVGITDTETLNARRKFLHDYYLMHPDLEDPQNFLDTYMLANKETIAAMMNEMDYKVKLDNYKKPYVVNAQDFVGWWNEYKDTKKTLRDARRNTAMAKIREKYGFFDNDYQASANRFQQFLKDSGTLGDSDIITTPKQLFEDPDTNKADMKRALTFYDLFSRLTTIGFLPDDQFKEFWNKAIKKGYLKGSGKNILGLRYHKNDKDDASYTNSKPIIDAFINKYQRYMSKHGLSPVQDQFQGEEYNARTNAMLSEETPEQRKIRVDRDYVNPSMGFYDATNPIGRRLGAQRRAIIYRNLNANFNGTAAFLDLYIIYLYFCHFFSALSASGG